MEQELEILRRRLKVAERQERLAREAKRRIAARLSPRLWAMYRMGRAQPVSVLLSATDFASLVWRSRAMGRVLERDLELLAELGDVSRFQQRSARALERLKDSLNARLEQVRTEQARASSQREELSEALVLIRAESKHSTRIIRELESAERELSRVLESLGEGLSNTGFGALRGKLPYPTEGILEVGFGRVVNPKFNTVTVQKGVDLRAPLGTPVRAVYPGKVVYGGWLRGYGNVLILDHGDGFHTLMAHLSDFTVPLGASVDRGQEVGAVGDTGSLKGSYLYFEIRQQGQAMDPSLWLSERVRFR
jgi:murein hydrolase activator